ncbi:hypothetical protein [Inquilinus sp.]|uniref:hypothetical protein n=1 Tax=Inquilinus sp. TaxID=1932117 RepID=UPI0031D692B3
MRRPSEYRDPAAGEALPHPWLVLATAAALPGVGHLLLRMPQRALTFACFVLVFGWISLHLAPPAASPAGRLAGGLFVQALAILDAYRWARLRWEARRVLRREDRPFPG